MAGLLDMNQINQEASMRGLLGMALGIGQASGPSPVPVSPLAAITQGGVAGINAYDNSMNSSLQRGLLGMQIGKLQQEGEQKRMLQLYAASLPPEQRARLIQAAAGVNPDQTMGGLGTRPWNITQGPQGFQNAPGALNAMSEQTVATEGPKTALDIIGALGKPQPVTPITAGGGAVQGGPTTEGSMDAARQLLPGGLFGGQSNTQLRGNSGVDQLGATSTVTGSRPMSPFGLDLQNFQAPKPQMRTLIAPTKDAPGMQRGAMEEDYGKAGVKLLEETRLKADEALREMRGYSQVRQSIANGFSPGLETGFKDTAARVLMAFGASEEAVSTFFNQNPADKKAFQSATDVMVAAMAKQLGTNPTDSDREFVRNALISTRDTPQAVTRLLDFFEASAINRIKKYDGMVDWIEQKKNPYVFDRNWNREHGLPAPPVSKAPEKKAATPAQDDIAEPTPGVPPVPASPREAKKGELYRNKAGKVARWNGMQFVPVD